MHAKCLIQENEWEVRAAKRGVDTLAMAFYSVLHASPLPLPCVVGKEGVGGL